VHRIIALVAVTSVIGRVVVVVSRDLMIKTTGIEKCLTKYKKG